MTSSSLGSILNTSLSLIQASQAGISVASNNISNAQNPEYTRQRLVTAPGPSLDGNGVPSGVDIVAIEALRNQLVDARRLQENSNRAGADLLNRTLGDVEVQFTDTDDKGLLRELSKFFDSFQNLSTDPASHNFREQVRTAAESLMSAFKSMSEDLKNTQTLVDRSMTDQVRTINTLAGQIAAITGQIANQELTGPANDLRDRRGALVKQLSDIVDVQESEAGGTYQLTIGNHNALVFGPQTSLLTAQTDATGFTAVHYGKNDITGQFQGGELGANLELRDTYIPKYLHSLDQLAYDIADKVNERHSAGYDLNGNTGISFFQPLADSGGAAARLSLSSDVEADVSHIAASGDSNGQGNEVATQLGNLMFQQVLSGGSVTDQYRTLVFQVGSDVSDSKASLQQHEAMAQQLEIRRQSISGVSVDEETVQVLQFQRAYQAAARLIRTVDELTQSLLQI